MSLKNSVKEKYKSGKQSIGTFLNMGSAIAAECAGIAGLDYFIVDTEHSPFGLREVTAMIQASEIRHITPFVRIKHITRGAILKALDVGAQGLVIPGIKKKEEVSRIIEFGKYPPLGNRGFCPTRCCGYGYTGELLNGIDGYMETINSEIMLIPQCETRECLEQVEDIIALDGVDGIFIGPFDLSISLGAPGNFDDPKMKNAVDRVLKACKAADKPALIFATSLESAKMRLEQGFDSVTYNADLNILLERFKEIAKELRGS
jgi:4-hydroxy-2-oxoheptanedioate aldolase